MRTFTIGEVAAAHLAGPAVDEPCDGSCACMSVPTPTTGRRSSRVRTGGTS